MNHKFVVDKGSKGLRYQIQVAESSTCRKHWIEARPQDSVYCDGSFEDKGDCYRSSKRLDPLCLKSENVDFRKISQKNVFIDSYYPKLLGDFSEGCTRNSSLTQKVWTENASESDSRKTYDTWGNISRELYKDNESKKLEKMTSHKSSRSRLTLNCNTYPLISMNSDIESFFSSANNLNICKEIPNASPQYSYELRKVTEDEVKAWMKEEKRKILSDCTEGCHEVRSTTDCFTHLYNRIEALEELLQENSGTHRVREASGAAKAIRETGKSDTENELWKIRKRLNALEKKLRDPKKLRWRKNSATFLSVFAGLNEKVTLKSNRCPEMYNQAKLKKSKFPKEFLSQATFVIPSDFLILSKKSGKKREIAPIIGIIDRDKRKKKTKCKKIKRKTSSVYSSRRKTFRPKKTSIKINEKSFRVQSILKVKSSQSGMFNIIKQNDSSTIISDIWPEEKIIFVEKPKKNHRHKRNKLCKKTSITNMVLGESEQKKRNGECELVTEGYNLPNIKRNLWTLTDPLFHNTYLPPCSCYMTLTPDPCHNLLLKKNSNSQCNCDRNKKIKPSDPIEILKKGGKIKIPVLFEEICKSSGSKTPGHNSSDVSIRFVMVQRNHRPPLRKLIKKFTQKTTPKMDNYLFGVNKCSCSNQVFSF